MNRKKKSPFKFVAILCVIAIVITVFWYATQGNNANEISLTQIASMIDPNTDGNYEDSQIQAMIAQDNVVIVLKKDSSISQKDFEKGKKYDLYATYSSSLDLSEIRELAIKANISFTSKPNSTPIINYIMPFIYVGLILLVGFLVLRMVTRSNNNAISFGKTKNDVVKTSKVRFSDVAGADEEAVMTTACEEYHAYEYGASFPSLISIDGELTYVCVVTDKEFVVKNWVFINMKDISKLITAKSETEGFEKYRQLLKKGSITTTTETEVNTENADDIEQIDGVRLYTENGITFVEIDTNGTTVKYKVSQ